MRRAPGTLWRSRAPRSPWSVPSPAPCFRPSCCSRQAAGRRTPTIRGASRFASRRVARGRALREPVVILEERAGSRRLPIWIGYAEASSIASELAVHRGAAPERPRPREAADRRARGQRLARGRHRPRGRRVLRAHRARARGADASRSTRVRATRSPSRSASHAPLFVNEPLFEKALEAAAGGRRRAASDRQLSRQAARSNAQRRVMRAFR